jgi:uncharacterized protein (DUF362 family)
MVAIGQAPTYQPELIRQELVEMLGGIGGIDDLIKPGSRVGLKVNLTGGTWWDTPDKPPANEFFVTHPTVVGMLGELLLDLGANKLVVMDGLGDETSFEKWGYRAMAKPLGAELVDLCKPNPYTSFDRFDVGPNANIYDHFTFNGSLNEVDVFFSISKLKCHSVAGITLSLKNLIGLAPISHYRLSDGHNHRSAFHGNSDFDTRLPGVILDLNQARPIHFALIDGVATAEGGAGPWDAGLAQVKPGVLIAGRDPVAVDAVGTAVMGFDPNASAGSQPFVHSENHLAMAHDLGLGTIDLNEIGIAGAQIQDVRYEFTPAG